VGMSYAGWAAAMSPGMSEAKATGEGSTGDKVGRLVRITSISFPNGKWFPVDQIVPYVDKAGAAGVDVIALPEVCTGQNDKSEEDLSGPTVTAMSALAKKHKMYIVLPMDRRNKNLRPNTQLLLDRGGKVACLYDEVFPYWEEYELHPPVDVGYDTVVYRTDFGMLGFANCFDTNFPEVWKRLADQGAEVVIWSSAYSAGTSLQSHAINNHYYIVTSTKTADCLVWDINGEKLLYQKSDNKVNVTTVTLDLDRGIYHENFNIRKRDRLLKEHSEDVAMEKWMHLEQWFILKAKRPGVSARDLAKQYGLEELRHYVDRSRQAIDVRRGWQYEARVVFPDLDESRLKALSTHARKAAPSGTTGK